MSKSAFKGTLLLLSLLFLLILPQQALAEAFVIDDYHVEVTVGSDYTYAIKETLAVDFSEARRGIIRTIPLRFSDRPMRIEDIHVPDATYQVSRENDMASIRIGDEDVYLTGQVHYQIEYTLVLGSDADPSQDLFYLNLIGNEWDTSIKNMSFSITMPFAYDQDKLTLTRGPLGSEETDDIAFDATPQKITGNILTPLEANEGLSVYLPLPEGYFSDVKPPAFWPNLGIPALGILLLLFSFVIFQSKGRDDHIVVTPEFYPPKGMTPAEAGYVIDRVVHPLDVTSLILYWASKGYLDVEEDGKKHLTLYKIKDLSPKDSQHFERYFFDALFQKGDGNQVSTRDLKGKFYQEMVTTQGLVRASFVDNKNRRLYKRESTGYQLLLFLFSILPLWGLFAYTFYLIGNGYISTTGLFMSALPALLPAISIALMAHALVNRKTVPKSRTAGFFLGGLVLFVISLLVILLISMRADTLLLTLLILVITIGIGFLAQATEKRTAFGTEILGLMLGYKQFLTTAEKDRIERLLDENPNYFYDTLPYAQVLGVTKKWAKKFEGLNLEPPSYYRGNTGIFNAYVFATVLDRHLSSAATTMAINPKANSGGSGFSGGGFSGGGAGGGGGSSW